MNYSNKLGLRTLTIYMVMSIGFWLMADGLSTTFIAVLFNINTILSIIIWYEAIRKGMSKSIKDGIIVSTYFIVPYALIALTTYKALFRDELKDIVNIVIWMIFSNPMRIVSYEIASYENACLELMDFSVFVPLMVVVMLLVINIIIHLLKRSARLDNTTVSN